MKSAGFLNLPSWKENLQTILLKMGREELLKLPILGRENTDNCWSAFEADEFFSIVDTGIYFSGSPLNQFPSRIITSDGDFALKRLKEGLGKDTYFSAAIGGLFPFIKMLPISSVSRIKKIYVQNDAFAGFVLATMEKKGKSFEEAICDARWHEQWNEDSKFSLHGITTRNRLALDFAEIFGCFVEPEKITYAGMNNLESIDIKIAKELGMSLRLLGIGEFDGQNLKAVAEPCLIPQGYFLAQARGGSEIIYAVTEDNQSLVYACPGTSEESVVGGIVQDIDSSNSSTKKEILNLTEVGDFENRFYLRFNIMNLTTTLSELLKALKQANIEIESIYQPNVSCESADGVSIVIYTVATQRKLLEKAINSIKENIRLAELKSYFRIIDRG